MLSFITNKVQKWKNLLSSILTKWSFKVTCRREKKNMVSHKGHNRHTALGNIKKWRRGVYVLAKKHNDKLRQLQSAWEESPVGTTGPALRSQKGMVLVHSRAFLSLSPIGNFNIAKKSREFPDCPGVKAARSPGWRKKGWKGLVTQSCIPSMRLSRQEYWRGSPFPTPKDLPDPGIEPGSPTLQADPQCRQLL